MKQKITITLEKDVIGLLDGERGDVTRSTFLQRILERKYKIKRK